MTQHTTILRTLRYGKGYAGKMGTKCWAARITGTDSTYGLQREFLEPVRIERKHYNRARTMVDFSYELEVDNLYELSEAGERWFVGVWPHKESGEVVIGRISDERVQAWVMALDAGQTPLEARQSSKAATAEKGS